jgi:hypothetical protein
MESSGFWRVPKQFGGKKLKKKIQVSNICSKYVSVEVRGKADKRH